MRVVRVFQRVSRPLDSLFSSGGARGGWACSHASAGEAFDDVGYKNIIEMGIIIYYHISTVWYHGTIPYRLISLSYGPIRNIQSSTRVKKDQSSESIRSLTSSFSQGKSKGKRVLFLRCSMVVLFTEIKRDRTTLLRPIALFSRTTGTNCTNREQPPRYRC